VETLVPPNFSTIQAAASAGAVGLLVMVTGRGSCAADAALPPLSLCSAKKQGASPAGYGRFDGILRHSPGEAAGVACDTCGSFLALMAPSRIAT
jgi:hypothetical protein